MEKDYEICEDCVICYSDDAEQPAAADGSKWAMKGRLNSRVLWSAIVGLIVTLASAFNLWDKVGLTSEAFSGIMAAVGAVLAAFGVLNNPTDSEGF